MKTPNSRPRFQSATRHYHRYREENRDGWSNWVDGTKEPGKPKGRNRRKWILAAIASTGVAILIGVVVNNFL